MGKIQWNCKNGRWATAKAYMKTAEYPVAGSDGIIEILKTV
jgi:hypothetical protein